MVKLKIEIDLGDLVQNNIVSEKPFRQLPTVDAEYGRFGLNNGKVWYKTYTKGESRWVRMEGRSDGGPHNCTDIIVRMSPGNTDILEDKDYYTDPIRGEVTYDDYPNDLYVQSEKLRQLERLGYEESENNFPELID